MIKIINGLVFEETGNFVKKEISVEGERFLLTDSKSEGDAEVIDAEGCYIIPGLTDIHFHGCVGYDFCDGTEEAITAMAKYEASNGVTTICPATMTLSEEQLMKICEAARAHQNKEGAELVGINMEGPFISEAKKGAQNGAYIHKPDVKMYRRLQEASGGMFKLVDIAPEEPDAMETIAAIKDEVVVSIAHTTADYDTAKKAMENGATHLTHMYNAMPPFTHRAPGVIGAACDMDCEAELICDGIHIHPSVVRTSLKMFGSDKIIFISDSMMATGMEDGLYALGGQPVYVKGNLATLKDGTIAGSATNLMDCVRTAVKTMEVPLGTAVKCAAVNSAKCIGIYDRYGSIDSGKIANFVILNKDLSTRAVYQKGKVINFIP